MHEESVTTRTVRAAPGPFAPGHLGELTQTIDFALVDAVLDETRTQHQRRRLLPSRVVVYFVLALALFEHCSYRAVWDKLTAGLSGLCLIRPAMSSLSRARRRIGAAPLQLLFDTLSGPVGLRGQAGVFHKGLRTVAVDGTCLRVPDDPALTRRYPKRPATRPESGYPLLRLLVLIECGTRAVLAAAFGPDATGELSYARRMLHALDTTMLLLADAGFDAADFLRDITTTGAQFLIRATARRRPTPLRHLPDGSYLALLGAGVLCPPLLVRIIEAQITITLADGTIRTEQWRLLTSLHDHTRHPAHELVALYHERWQTEITYYSIKATMLDGRVLRSRSLTGIEQEVYALLATYQALIRTAADTTTGLGLDMDRLSFTILLQTAGDLVTTASNILPAAAVGPADLTGAIGRALLRDLLPAWRRPRVKARTRKNPVSKYGPRTKRHPAIAQTYTFYVQVRFLDGGIAPRTQR